MTRYFATRACSICGGEYQPASSTQKYCADCGYTIGREKDRIRAAAWYTTNQERAAKGQAERRRQRSPELIEDVRCYMHRYFQTNFKRLEQMNGARRKIHPQWDRVNSQKRRALKYGNTPLDELLTSTEWLAILAEHDGHCHYCGNIFEHLTLDHVIPLSKGGKHSAGNVVPACLHCNCSKGTKIVEAWKLTQVKL